MTSRIKPSVTLVDQLSTLIITQVLLCCFEDRAAGKLLAPKRGSYSCLARVAGLQRLPGQALVRVIVTDRVAVQVCRVLVLGIIRCLDDFHDHCLCPLSASWGYGILTISVPISFIDVS